MGGSKHKKIVSNGSPKERSIVREENPDSYYSSYPSWCFKGCDNEMWAFTEKSVGLRFWSEILPCLKGLETQQWKQILIDAKKQNHSINVDDLNPAARDRLKELYIEQEAIISLRTCAKHRIYGFITNGVFYILWYDSDHGDNSSCVCRSHKKHT